MPGQQAPKISRTGFDIGRDLIDVQGRCRVQPDQFRSQNIPPG